MDLLKTGIIGLGVGERHIAGYQRHPDCEVTMLCDFSEEKQAMARAKYPHIQICQDAGDILRSPDIDIVSIASYDNFHYTQVAQALETGKHVFVEKPLCLHEKELEHIKSLLANKPGIRLSSNLILRMSPRFRNLHQRIQHGELGELFYVEGDYNYGRIHKIHAGWRGQLDYYSVVLGGAVHMVDLLLWLSGDRPTEVSAFGTAIASRQSTFRYDDTVVALIKFASGLVGKISANFACVHPHFHGLSLYGTKATFINGVPNAQLYTSRSPEVKPIAIDAPYRGTHKGDLIYSFVDTIVNGGRPEVSEEEVLNAMAVCFAIIRACATSTTEPVTYDERHPYAAGNTLWKTHHRQRRKAGCA